MTHAASLGDQRDTIAPALSPERRRTGLVVAGLLVLVFAAGAAIEFAHLGAGNIAGDEVTYVSAGWQYVHGTFTANLEHPLTGKYLIGLAELVVGHPSVTVGRLVSATLSWAAALVMNAPSVAAAAVIGWFTFTAYEPALQALAGVLFAMALLWALLSTLDSWRVLRRLVRRRGARA